MRDRYLGITLSLLLAACESSAATDDAGRADGGTRSDAGGRIEVDSGSVDAARPDAGPIVPAELQGFGASAVGGSESDTVYHVTNLDSSGPGSLANGIGSDRTIVFDLSGTIVARLDLSDVSYLTIDASGQDITIDNDNNGDGISIAGPDAHHIILRNLRVINAGNDGINVIDGAHDVLITDCSAYDNGDGNIDVAAAEGAATTNVTVQYSIVGRHRSGGVGGTLVTAQNVSLHHNLFSPAGPDGEEGERCPLVHANYSDVGSPNADVRNNLIWRFGRDDGQGSGYGTAIAYDATGNIVNNYYYTEGTSPNSATNADDGYGGGATGLAFIAGNVSGNDGASANAESTHAEWAIPAQYQVVTDEACAAARDVLANAGPEQRDDVEQAIVDDASELPRCP